MFRRQIYAIIILTVSMAWHSTTQSGGIWPFPQRDEDV
jgi:hypothetical protein